MLIQCFWIGRKNKTSYKDGKQFCKVDAWTANILDEE